MRDAGKNLVSGLIEGMTSRISSIVDKAKEIGRKTLDAVKGIWDIHSPSRAAKSLANFFGLGLLSGLDESKDKVSSSAEDLANAALSPFEGLQAGININLNKPDLDAALNSSMAAKALMQAQTESKMYIELSLKGGIEKFADAVEARVVNKLSSSIGGVL
jgi:phage-related protein